jgi:periplasmic protein TonB
LHSATSRTTESTSRHKSYRARKAEERRVARERVEHWTTHALDPRTLRLDPLALPERTATRRLGSIATFGGLALLLHVAIGIWMIRGSNDSRSVDDKPITIELAPPPPPPPPEPEPEPPAPEPEPLPTPKPKIERIAKPEPVTATPEPPPETPPPPDVKPPPRIIGLSLDSTATGGDGPSFAVGNSLAGKTAQKAVDAKDVAPVGLVDAEPTPVEPNRVASKIPTIGVQFGAAKRRNPNIKPPYPETLKAQGLEGTVSVILGINASGKVTTVKVVGKVLYPEFEESARRFAMALEFEPATRNGVPVATSISFDIKFRLEDQ